jgi:hypothetical protein
MNSEQMKDLKAAIETTHSLSSCTNCGYCPHCGRGGYRTYYDSTGGTYTSSGNYIGTTSGGINGESI